MVPPMKGGTTYGQCTVHRRAVPPNRVPGFHQRDPRRVSAAGPTLRGSVSSAYGGVAPRWETPDRPPRVHRSRCPFGLPPFAHDGTERRIVRPQDPPAQTECYSGKKKDHTVKNVLLVNALLTILFLSDSFGGRVHDKHIADATPYPLPAGSRLLQGLRCGKGVTLLTNASTWYPGPGEVQHGYHQIMGAQW